jgi:NAD(P)-dependent dehydrogenase (short-subunit alcohol dehydrogenase family)
MNTNLTGKTALVTGSTAGIGHAIAGMLASQGALVWINGRTRQRVDDAIAAIRKTQPDANLQGAPADAATSEGLKQLIAAAPAVDILVNNVGGVNAFKAFEELSDADWQQAFDLNVMTGVRLTKHYLPAMRKKNWGRVVFISSESGVQIPAEFIQYGAMKAAVIATARGIAETLLSSGVTVNSVLAGPTMSEILGKVSAASGKSPADFERDFMSQRRATSLVRRFMTTEEVASMVGYLCSPAASGTHGAALRVEGGVVKSAF